MISNGWLQNQKRRKFNIGDRIRWCWNAIDCLCLPAASTWLNWWGGNASRVASVKWIEIGLVFVGNWRFLREMRIFDEAIRPFKKKTNGFQRGNDHFHTISMPGLLFGPQCIAPLYF